MVRKTDTLLKNIVQELGVLIDARFKVFETNLKAHIRSEILASEERTNKKLKKMDSKMATKEDIKDMVRKKDIENMATKQDIARLENKMDKTNL